jgi:arsenate reductase
VTHGRDGDETEPESGAPLVLFVCAHGAAKSVLAAAEFRRRSSAAGLAVDAEAAGVEPDATVAPAVIDFLPEQARKEPPQPRRVTEGDLARAWRTVTFDLEPSDLPADADVDERWDGLPSAGEDPEGFLAQVTPRVAALVRELAPEASGLPR